MDVEYSNDNLARLATDPDFTMGLPPHVAQKYRDRIALIQAAPDERTLYALRGSLDYKKLKGGQDHHKQMRLNQQYRIRLEVTDRDGHKVILITGATDFH
jgi:plasmid maintenance system killer protein